jgi:hypothetical protein
MVKELTLNKLAAALVAVAMMAGLAFAFAAERAHAITLAELVELFIALEVIPADKASEARAVISTVPTTPVVGEPTMSCNFTRNLGIGMTGTDVMDLQKLLNLNGFTVAVSGAGSPGQESSYYGQLTAAAVSKMQGAFASEILTPLGLSAGTGYFGASTRAKANALCAAAPTTPTVPTVPTVPTDPTEPTTPTTPVLSGDEGSMGYVEIFVPADLPLDLGEVETVLEVELEAVDSDIMVNRVDVLFSERPWLYFDEVNLVMDGVEVATLSRSGDFTQVGSNWRARFTGLDLVIREDDTADLSVEVRVLDSMASTRLSHKVNVSIPENGIRGRDGAGFDQYAPDAVSAMTPVEVGPFSESFTDGDIRLTLSSKSPQKATILLNETGRTNGVSVLYFDIEARDDDMEVTDVWVEFAVGTGTVEAALHRARLYDGNTLLDTKSVSDNIVKFEGVDRAISERSTREFRVEVDFNRGDGLDLPTSFTVSSTTVVAENSNFIPATKLLNVDEVHTIIYEGMVAELVNVTSTAVAGTDGKTWKYTFTMDVQAVGDTFYVSRNGTTTFASAVGANDFGQIKMIKGSSTNPVAVNSVTISSNATLVSADNAYRVGSGQTQRFTVDVFVSGAAAPGTTVALELENMWFGPESNDVQDQAIKLGSPEFESSSEYISA